MEIMGRLFKLWEYSKDIKATEEALVVFILFKFFKFIPPRAQIFIFQFNVIKLNLITSKILLFVYFLL